MTEHPFEVQKPVVLFDGMCNYCNGIVNFILKHDKHERFLFSASQSEAGKMLLKKFSIENIAEESVVLIEQEKVFIKSTAVLMIYRHLNGLLPLLYVGMIAPRFIRDAMYDVIANNRYKWFGKRESCMVPDEKMKSKFLQ